MTADDVLRRWHLVGWSSLLVEIPWIRMVDDILSGCFDSSFLAFAQSESLSKTVG